jgi:hypothetical protein
MYPILAERNFVSCSLYMWSWLMLCSATADLSGNFVNFPCTHCICGPGSVVDIATGYGLDGPGIESRWGGAIFFAPVQNGPGAHPASCKMGTSSFPGVKSG